RGAGSHDHPEAARTGGRMKLAKLLSLALLLAAVPASAQTAESPEKASIVEKAAGDSAKAEGTGTEHHTGGPSEADEEEGDPSKHFNYFGIEPGHLFDYIGKDEYGGKFGDGVMEDPETHHVVHEEEAAS